ncbi:MAG: hypothetical protein COZ70_08490 [Deltaproteobacteria bacterium CG_4_8_14_3_um_filter_51_11]|nr:MAG: hypothetical protein AUK25_09180 [Desulfobacteraceae bacterium CG2_30_51_40]PIP47177.1 MAG: hypothetical protein COX16_05875 [Deltaproteobacteria bacterium CG23_combo_of_CG06-09_8_20_14_all_51_20]PIX19545.1 MAG: hypothetical protein COZ70_08490 [Deltaproteobacteria bacterium CG_4_8_14_3_um_filter_51_11]
MEFCDLTCLHAVWPKDQALDGAGSCMTFQALYCTKKAMHVHKNMPCPEKEKKHCSDAEAGMNLC